MLNQTFLRTARSLAETLRRWRVSRPSAERVVDSFELYFGRGWKKKGLITLTVFETKNEMCVHIRFAST